MQHAIAVLDSGVGGLTVVKELMRQLPQENILYFGDTARAPYGSRPAEQIKRFTIEVVDYLLQYQPKLIVIACNTATAFALEDIRQYVTVPVIGVIHSGVKAAIAHSRSGVIGVIGTEGTIKSEAYEREIKLHLPSAEVISLACQSFVPLVESGNNNSKEAYLIVEDSLLALRNRAIDTLILGCTHYPFLSGPIRKGIGDGVELINSAEAVVKEVKEIMMANDELVVQNQPTIHQFMCSGSLRTFQQIAHHWLGDQLRYVPVVWRTPRIVSQ
ncbi:MAG: glutamate racemase [Candidatus Cohnella colombiensis]|uniref:Glutamate racemase n=1 Tax=Candidatus Cohnella colombiensis TaxID=3121368 RepID=A0AA95EZF2_9BACL|nr:MAG: glutamate racemase [Cohnella sp.]